MALLLLASLFACNKDKKEEPQGAKIESISFKQESYSVEAHQTDGLNLRGELKIAPAVMADTCKITWALTNTDVATISKDGVITPKKVGETMVTATVQGKSAQCKYTVTKHVVPVESVKVIPASFADDVNVGATKKLEIEVEPSDATYETVAWKSSNTAVATVSADGTVTCKGEGTATITATIDGKEGTCKVTYSNSIVHVTSVSVSPATISENVSVGATKQLSATVLPADATDKTVTWKSSNTAVATVSSTGLVTCKGKGSCTITATADGKEGTCNVTYTKVPVTSVTINPSTWTGEAIIDYSGRALVAEILPENATDKTVTWESSDPNVAVVEQPEGSYTSYTSFTCKGPGTATITATCDGKKGTCTVTFTKVSVQSVTVTPSTYIEEYQIGDTKQLTASVYPWTATYKTVTWNSSDEDVATVDDNGLVTFTGIGSATITATADGKSGKCEITYLKRVESVKLNYGSFTLTTTSVGLSATKTVQLKATVTPEDATYPTVTWKSSNTSVATVDNNGVVTAKAKGNTTITATADGQSATCEITVLETETVTDISGNSYLAVKIGNQWWMAENLRCKLYDTQSERPGVFLKTVYDSQTMDLYGPYCLDASDSSLWETSAYAGNISIGFRPYLGYVYTWAAAVGLSSADAAKAQTSEFTSRRQGICPNGWHLPTKSEFETLVDEVGRPTEAGRILKAATGWNGGVGVNEYKFSALPSGYGYENKIRSVGTSGRFWTTTSALSETAWNIGLASTSEAVGYEALNKYTGISVRCVKN